MLESPWLGWQESLPKTGRLLCGLWAPLCPEEQPSDMNTHIYQASLGEGWVINRRGTNSCVDGWVNGGCPVRASTLSTTPSPSLHRGGELSAASLQPKSSSFPRPSPI